MCTISSKLCARDKPPPCPICPQLEEECKALTEVIVHFSQSKVEELVYEEDDVLIHCEDMIRNIV